MFWTSQKLINQCLSCHSRFRVLLLLQQAMELVVDQVVPGVSSAWRPSLLRESHFSRCQCFGLSQSNYSKWCFTSEVVRFNLVNGVLPARLRISPFWWSSLEMMEYLFQRSSPCQFRQWLCQCHLTYQKHTWNLWKRKPWVRLKFKWARVHWGNGTHIWSKNSFGIRL